MPETKYARASDGVYIAYQAFGDGDVCVVNAPGIFSNIEAIWEDREAAKFLETVSSFCRFVHFDKRGQGLSDRVAAIPSLEQRAADLRAVMDAERIDRAVVTGISEGGTTAAFFAATEPHRVSALAVFGSFAKVLADADYPGGDPARLDALIEAWPATWGTPDTITVDLVAPDRKGDRYWIEWLNHYERQSSSPSGVRAQLEWVRDIDIRSVLPLINVPTLVMHRSGDRLIPVAHGRWLAAHIPDARFVELPGTEHVPFLNYEGPVAELEEFVTGRRPPPSVDRVLATVLFTDIVSSTQHASALGDRRWHDLLDRHDAMARRIVERYDGRIVKSTGDGLLGIFTGPANAVRCAVDLVGAAEQLGVTLRAGLHAGEVEVRGDDVAGIAVHIAARVSSEAAPGTVLASRTVKDLILGSGITLHDLGEHALKGVENPWQLFQISAR
jgi:class 3 adenylate cyclase